MRAPRISSTIGLRRRVGCGAIDGSCQRARFCHHALVLWSPGARGSRISATGCVCEPLCLARRKEKMAEGTGFEPAMPLRTYLFSRQAHSTALPPLRRSDGQNRTKDKSNRNFW